MAEADALRARLAEAHQALAEGSAADAERRARALREIMRAERELTEFLLFQEANNSDRSADAVRDDVLGRIARLIAAPDELSDAEFDRIAMGDVGA
ncbi:MAG: hypothetical protein J0L81_07760 [Caulobacterales bacterium]|jgi:hypothetical protein|nr:hypothetical protein [Caulobacterales bacterium]